MIFNVRPIQPQDNPALEHLVKVILTEFGCVGEGYAYADPELSDLYTVYDNPQSRYWVVEAEDGRIVGGGGFTRLKGTTPEEGICELQKLYFLPETRGQGLGHQVIQLCIEHAPKAGYREIYLETVSQMHQAVHVYKKNGFESLEGPLGNTGHHRCGIFMSRPLEAAVKSTLEVG